MAVAQATGHRDVTADGGARTGTARWQQHEGRLVPVSLSISQQQKASHIAIAGEGHSELDGGGHSELDGGAVTAASIASLTLHSNEDDDGTGHRAANQPGC